jgi:hypothetical protein
MLLAWNHRSETPLVHVWCNASDVHGNGSGIKIAVIPRSVWDTQSYITQGYPPASRDELRTKYSEAALVRGYPDNTAVVAQSVATPGHGQSMNMFTYVFNQRVIRGTAIIEALTASTRQEDLADAFTWFQDWYPPQRSDPAEQYIPHPSEKHLQFFEHRIKSVHGITTTPGEQVPVPTRAVNVEVAYMMMSHLHLAFDVKLGGLVVAAHLNGRKGVICGQDCTNLERWKVLLDDTTSVSVKSANFVHVRQGEYRRISPQ